VSCPNCGHETHAASCENCGRDLTESQPSVRGSEIAGHLAGGVIVALIVGFPLGFLFFSFSVGMNAQRAATGSSWSCLPQAVPLLVAVAIALALVALIVPAVRRRLGIGRTPQMATFFVAFAVVLLCPFVACDTLFAWTPLSGGSCLHDR
jgi:cytochrome c biogenesis factor